VPATQTLPAPTDEPLVPDEEPLAPDDEPLVPDEDPLLPVEDPQYASRFRPHASSSLAHAPSMHAAVRYESPLEQSQHEGLHCANVEQLAPAAPVPVSLLGEVGQEPLVCSVVDDTFDELLLLLPLGSFESLDCVGECFVPPSPVPVVVLPPLQAAAPRAMRIEGIPTRRARIMTGALSKAHAVTNSS
jgi:hypothetical protein